MILNKIKAQIVEPVENFKILKLAIFCQPAYLSAIRPTSSWRMGPDFSYNAEEGHANTDLLFRLRFKTVSPLILLCLPFPLTGE